jgi:hypothetical protein
MACDATAAGAVFRRETRDFGTSLKYFSFASGPGGPAGPRPAAMEARWAVRGPQCVDLCFAPVSESLVVLICALQGISSPRTRGKVA